jgi:hypothetical protein
MISMEENSFSEECWFMRGFVLGRIYLWVERYVSKGTGCAVEFDWEKAWEDKRIIGWRHTHPDGSTASPSAMDNRVMRSWVKSFGKSMVCGISCGGDTRYYLYLRSCIGIFFISPVNFICIGPLRIGFKSSLEHWCV